MNDNLDNYFYDPEDDDIDLLTDEEKDNPSITGSLADLMGFPKTTTKLARLWRKRLSEKQLLLYPL